MRTATGSLPENSNHANPAQKSLRDRSSQQPCLSVEKTTWDNWRFMLRARRVRVSGPEKLKLKLFYLALAGFTDQLLKGVDIGKFTLPLVVMLHDLQLAEKTFYKLRRELRKLGLLDWKQRRNRSTEYRVFTRREWALLVPCFDNPRSVTFTDRDRYRLPTYLDLYRGTESTSSAAAAVVPAETTRSDQQQQQRQNLNDRIEAMMASCEISCRETGRPAFETVWHREQLASGELTIEAMQEFTNGLRAERDERRGRVRR